MNELLVKFLGEVKPSSWPKRRLWINLCKAEGSPKTAVQHSGANEACLSATREAGRMSCSFWLEIQSGGSLMQGIYCFQLHHQQLDPEYLAICMRCSAVDSIQLGKVVCSLWIIFVHEQKHLERHMDV